MLATVVRFGALAASAEADHETYYDGSMCGSTSATRYPESGGVHTFGQTWSAPGTRGRRSRAGCLRSGSVNTVSHGYGSCRQRSINNGSTYLWAFPYNRSSATRYVLAEAYA